MISNELPDISTPGGKILALHMALTGVVSLINLVKAIACKTGPNNLLASSDLPFNARPRIKPLVATNTRELKALLKERRGVPRDVISEVDLESYVLPATLQCQGWWERGVDEQKHDSNYPSLPRWLNHGFIQWAPSFDSNTMHSPELSRAFGSHFKGQLGLGDEANSIPLISPTSKFQLRKEGLVHFFSRGSREKNMAVAARVRGSLYPKHLLPRHILNEIKGSSLWMPGYVPPDFYIVVNDLVEEHCVEQTEDRLNEVYSGYMWLCVCKEEKWNESKEFKLPIDERDLVFVWEHTDFTSVESMHYNSEALNSKFDYLNTHRKYGPIVLLAKSMWFVSDKRPIIEEDVFLELIHRLSQNKLDF